MVFNTEFLLNAGQKNCRMLQREHSAILSTFIELTVTIKTFILSFFEWPFTQVLLHIVFVFFMLSTGSCLVASSNDEAKCDQLHA